MPTVRHDREKRMTEAQKLRPPERIETERLVLRVPTVTDAPAMSANYASDPEVTKYLTWAPHASAEESEFVLGMLAGFWEHGPAYPWAITIDDEIVGMIEARFEPPKAELAWVLSRSLWGRGFMTEAAVAVQEWCLEQPELWRVEAYVDVENLASSRVMEKIGMTLDGRLDRWGYHPNISDEPRDVLLYSMTH